MCPGSTVTPPSVAVQKMLSSRYSRARDIPSWIRPGYLALLNHRATCSTRFRHSEQASSTDSGDWQTVSVGSSALDPSVTVLAGSIFSHDRSSGNSPSQKKYRTGTVLNDVSLSALVGCPRNAGTVKLDSTIEQVQNFLVGIVGESPRKELLPTFNQPSCPFLRGY